MYVSCITGLLNKKLLDPPFYFSTKIIPVIPLGARKLFNYLMHLLPRCHIESMHGLHFIFVALVALFMLGKNVQNKIC